MKRCPMCKTLKGDDQFYRNCRDGLSPYCKLCSAIRKRKGTKSRAELMAEIYPAEGMKRCSTCLAVKPLEQFNAKSPGRLRPKCKACQYEQFKAWSSRMRHDGQPVPTRAELLAGLRAARFPTAETQVCTKCDVEQLRCNFRNTGRGSAFRCNSCRNQESKAHYRLNRRRAKLKRAAYRLANLARVREYARNGFKRRRAAKRGVVSTLTTAEWVAMVKACGGKCLACKRRRKLTQDHVIPLSKGGAHTAKNVQPLCGPCNSSKRTKIIDYRRAA